MKIIYWISEIILVAVLCVSLMSQSAHADKLCLQTTVNKKNFKVTNRSIVAASCPKGYVELADTASFRGADGSNVSTRCVTRENTASGSGGLSVSSSCLVNEYIGATGCHTSGGVGVVWSQELFTAPNSELSSEIYHTLRCYAYDPYAAGKSYTLTAQAQCCRGQ